MRDAADYFIRTAVLSSSDHRSAALFVELLKDVRFALAGIGTEMFQELARCAGGRNRQDEIPVVLPAALGQTHADLQRAVVIGLSNGLRFSGGQLSSWRKSLDAVAKKLFDDLIDGAVQVVADTQADGSQLKPAFASSAIT